MNKGTV